AGQGCLRRTERRRLPGEVARQRGLSRVSGDHVRRVRRRYRGRQPRSRDDRLRRGAPRRARNGLRDTDADGRSRGRTARPRRRARGLSVHPLRRQLAVVLLPADDGASGEPAVRAARTARTVATAPVDADGPALDPDFAGSSRTFGKSYGPMVSWKRDGTRGLVVLVPIIVTLYVLAFVYNTIASLPFIEAIQPAIVRVPLTLAVFALLVFGAGYLMRTASGPLVEGAIDDVM